MELFDRVDENSFDLRRTWDETSMNDLRRMWPDPQHSARTIAKELGFSRNAIISKAHRMGLAKNGRKLTTYARTRSPRNPNPPKPRSPQLWRALPTRDTGAARVSPSSNTGAVLSSHSSRSGEGDPSVTSDWSRPGSNASPRPLNVPLIDLKPGQCRWPMWDPDARTGLFCGADALEKLPYCSGHCAMAYRPSKARRLEAAE